MNKADAIEVLRVVQKSIKDKPNQFTWEISVVGSVNPTGIANISGGELHGGTVIGQSSQAVFDGGSQVEVRQTVDHEIKEKIKGLEENLALLIQAAEEGEGDKVQGFWKKIKEGWCPAVIFSLVERLIVSLIE